MFPRTLVILAGAMFAGLLGMGGAASSPLAPRWILLSLILLVLLLSWIARPFRSADAD